MIKRYFRCSTIVLALMICGSGIVGCGGTPDPIDQQVDEYKVSEALQQQLDGKYYVAMQRWSEILDDFPDYGIAWHNLGECNDHLSRFDDANDAYKHALNLNPSWSHTKYNYANNLLSMGRNSRGKALMREITEMDPYYPKGWYGLAAAEQSTHRPEEALEAINKCLWILGDGYPDAKPSDTPEAHIMYELKVMILLDLKRLSEANQVISRMKQLKLPIRDAVISRVNRLNDLAKEKAANKDRSNKR